MDRIKAIKAEALREGGALSSRVIVSLGDSFSSGEGIEPFYAQDGAERYTEPDFLAHRSQKSWPGRLTLPAVSGEMALHRGENWFFAAASGARAKHILEPQPKTGRVLISKTEENTQLFRTYPTTLLPPQIEIFKTLGDRKADYVTLTLGGNDACFSEMISRAAAAHTYIGMSFLKMKLDSLWQSFYAPGGIRDGLLKAYHGIAEAAGPQAEIIVAGYPRLFGGMISKTLFSRQATELLNSAVSDLNRQIEYLIAALRFGGMRIHFVSVENGFDSHEAYSSDDDGRAAPPEGEYIHRIILGAGANDIDGGKAAYAGSLHPNLLGSEVYRACVQKKIDELEAKKRSGASYLAGRRAVLPPYAFILDGKKPASDEDDFWAVKREPNENGEAKEGAAPKIPVLPLVIGGAAAVVSFGALVGAAVRKRTRKIVGAASAGLASVGLISIPEGGGENGESGVNGENGENGVNSVNGVNGVNGENGDLERESSPENGETAPADEAENQSSAPDPNVSDAE